MRHALILSLIAFAVHFVWETAQCPLFFVHGSYDASWRAMVVATLGDVAITWILYGSIAAVRRDWRWPRSGWKPLDWIFLIVLALAIGFFIELRALDQGRWQYRPGTPLFPGTEISIIPLLQLLLLTPAIIHLAEWMMRRLERVAILVAPDHRRGSNRRV